MAAIRYRIIPATNAHVYTLAATLRRDDAAELEAAGFHVKHGVRRTFRAALMRWSILVDDQLAGMFGMGGDALGDVGTPWLLTAPPIERIPVSFVREGRNAVRQMLRAKPILVNYVDARYTRACRFVEVLGFALEPPAPFGPKGALFRRFETRRSWQTRRCRNCWRIWRR
jgi:hypothetical protein